ncbi:MAG: shikimate kinase [Actinomycetota bacterium]
MNAARPHVVITGPMGVGKSTVAARLAAALGWPERDSDRDIERVFGVSGAVLAAEADVAQLHALEAAVLLGALAAPGPLVISAAASVVDNPWCRRAIPRRSRLVVLDAPVDVVLSRIPAGRHRRSIDAEDLEALIDRRRPHLDDLADLTVDATATIDAVVSEVLEHLSG